MKKALWLIVAIVGMPLLAADFEVKILSHPDQVPQGAPIFITYQVCNVSGRPVTIAKGAGGFEVRLSYHRMDGSDCLSPEEKLKNHVDVLVKSGYVQETLPAGWSVTRTEEIPCRSKPGILEARVVVQSGGGPSYPTYAGGEKVATFDAWTGEVDSGTVQIAVKEPRGADLEAWEATRGQPYTDPKLLTHYPLSTYAAYALLGRVPDYSNPLLHAVPASEQVQLIRDEGKRVVAFPQEDFEKYFQDMDSCLKEGNAPLNLRARLFGFYGDLLVQRGRFQEAEAAFKLALTDPSEDPESVFYKTRSQEFLRALSMESEGQWPKPSQAK
jgi:hypothetical protein